MLNWADELIQEYTVGKQDLKRRVDRLDRSNPIDMQDLKQINSMIESMSFSLDWMKTGRQPGTYRGADEKAVYQKRSYENIDLIPDIAEQLNSEQPKELYMTKEERVILADILSSFSQRERICYLLHVGHKKSMGEIAAELGVSKSTVQTHINRAKSKVRQRFQEAG
ncbi:sigma-70 family RNA polymerase sigma factor [Sporosarcina sp. ITBMC105]